MIMCVRVFFCLYFTLYLPTVCTYTVMTTRTGIGTIPGFILCLIVGKGEGGEIFGAACYIYYTYYVPT